MTIFGGWQGRKARAMLAESLVPYIVPPLPVGARRDQSLEQTGWSPNMKFFYYLTLDPIRNPSSDFGRFARWTGDLDLRVAGNFVKYGVWNSLAPASVDYERWQTHPRDQSQDPVRLNAKWECETTRFYERWCESATWYFHVRLNCHLTLCSICSSS